MYDEKKKEEQVQIGSEVTSWARQSDSISLVTYPFMQAEYLSLIL